VERRQPDAQRIREAVQLLKRAERPVIIAGGGVHYSEAWDELQAFSEEFGIPVGETFGGKGAIRGESKVALGGHGVTGNPAAAAIVSTADLVITVGTRLTDFTTGSQSVFNAPDVKFISVNVSGHDAYKEGALPILSDARECLRTLSAAAREAGVKPKSSYVDEVAGQKARWAKQLEEEVYTQVPGEGLSQGQLIHTINEQARPGDTIVTAAGTPPGDLLKIWDATRGRACHLEFGYSCMGYEIPAGIGVRMAQPEGEVYVFVGDGTYLLSPTELLTAAQEKLKITVVISENHGYQSIRGHQMARAGHPLGTEFRVRDGNNSRLEGDFIRVDLAKNAESMGARAWYVTNPDQLCTALREAASEKRACVIVAETEKYRYLPDSNVWWDIAPAEVSNDSVTQRLRSEYEEGREQLQRLHY
jgi:3D-(3,5/4)-trihydroxycyclohexane-1,2-dione acylhydrolase (decyclizing)